VCTWILDTRRKRGVISAAAVIKQQTATAAVTNKQYTPVDRTRINSMKQYSNIKTKQTSEAQLRPGRK